MPVIPTFSAFAQTPDLAQSWISGQQLRADQQKIAQQAAEAAARINLGYAQLHAQSQQAAMEWNTRKEIAGQEALRRQQEMEYEKSYQQQRIGLADQELKQQQQKLQLDVDAATRRVIAKSVFDQEKAKLMAQGIPEYEATGRAALIAGPELGMAPSVINQALTPLEEYYDKPQEQTGPSGTVYNRPKKGGPLTPVSPPSAALALPLQQQHQITDSRKELSMLIEEDAKAGERLGAKYVVAADKVMEGDLEAYKAMTERQRQEVDAIVLRRKRIQQIATSLGPLYTPANQAVAPGGSSTNQATVPPRIVRKTPK